MKISSQVYLLTIRLALVSSLIIITKNIDQDDQLYDFDPTFNQETVAIDPTAAPFLDAGKYFQVLNFLLIFSVTEKSIFFLYDISMGIICNR